MARKPVPQTGRVRTVRAVLGSQMFGGAQASDRLRPRVLLWVSAYHLSELFVDGDAAELTPGEARILARRLTSQAARVEDQAQRIREGWRRRGRRRICLALGCTRQTRTGFCDEHMDPVSR